MFDRVLSVWCEFVWDQGEKTKKLKKQRQGDPNWKLFANSEKWFSLLFGLPASPGGPSRAWSWLYFIASLTNGSVHEDVQPSNLGYAPCLGKSIFAVWEFVCNMY